MYSNMGEKLTLSLKWGSHQETVLHSLENSFGTQDFVDMTLACDGQSVQAHKVIVSACSSFLKKLLQDNPCPHPIIILKDMTMCDLKQLLEFMYCGQVTVEQKQLESLLQAAQSLGIHGLADVECTESTQACGGDIDMSREGTENCSKGMKSKNREPSNNSILASYLLYNSPPESKSLSLAELLSQPTTSNHLDSLIEDQEKNHAVTDSASETEVIIKQEKAEVNFDADLSTDDFEDVNDDLTSSKTVGKASALMVSLAKRAKHAAGHPYSTRSLVFHDPKPCVLCGKILRDDAALRIHLNNAHSSSQRHSLSSTPSVSGGPLSVQGTQGVQGVQSVQSVQSVQECSAEQRLAFYEARPCSICGKMYRDAASLRTHVSIMHTAWRDGFECSCKQVFQTKYEMYQHRRAHGKPGRAWPSPSASP